MSKKKLLVEKLNNILPQTQCTKCGFAECKDYAIAIADNKVKYNKCLPGGNKVISNLAAVLDITNTTTTFPLVNKKTNEQQLRFIAYINESTCIGCTLCFQACPIDAIVGAPKHVHTVLLDWCSGCDLCVQACPVNCISMHPISTENINKIWSDNQSQEAKYRFDMRKIRLKSKKNNYLTPKDYDILITTALQRAQQKHKKNNKFN